ncbi:MAG: O-antigen ligase family protein [Woeseiaceae bacterium]|nr:O-antigen ligase family protein [Woeseiaceae bacterium]
MSDGSAKSRAMRLQAEKLHPAAIFVALFMAVAVGRLPEIFEFLRPLHLGKVTLAAAIVAMLFNLKRSNTVLSTSLGVRMALFTALAILSLSFSIWGSRTLVFLELDLLRIVLLFVLIAKTTVNVRTLRFYLVVFAAILGLMALFGLLNATGARVEFSQSYDPNDIGLVVLTISALFFGLATDKALPMRKLVLLLSLVGFAIVLSTQSRGAFLGLCAVVLYFSIAQRTIVDGKFYQLPNPRVIGGMLAAFIVVFLITPDASWDRILTIFELEDDYNTTGNRGRMAIWTRGIETFLSKPWGVGGGAYQSSDLRAGGVGLTAHNSFLQVAVELGVAGLLIYISLYRSAWRTTRAMLLLGDGDGDGDGDVSRKGLSPGALALGIRCAIVGFLVSGFFLSMGYGRVFYALLGLIAACELLYCGSPVRDKQSARRSHRARSSQVSSTAARAGSNSRNWAERR